MTKATTSIYRRVLLDHPRSALTVLCLLLAFFAYHAKDFKLDASAESLLLEDDRDLQLMREVDARYETQELLIVTFTPEGDLFSDASLELLRELRDALRSADGVDSVMSILDVPLINSSDVPLLEMAKNVPTLESPTIDRARARSELHDSPVYRELILSRDGKTTALALNLERDQEFVQLMAERNRLLIRRGASGSDSEGLEDLPAVSVAYNQARELLAERRHHQIANLREVIEPYRSKAQVHLGGVAMIADDMITFVRNDLIVFGTGVFLFVIVVLAAIFREVRWIVLPLVSCAYAGLAMIGILGLAGWPVTVISSNFLALMLIITISMNIHLCVRFRQLQSEQPEREHIDLVADTITLIVSPCLYTALTTIIGFGSLVLSQIKPVQDFGWMMSAGLAVSFITSFTLFPALLALMPKGKTVKVDDELPFTAAFARLAEHRGALIYSSTGLLLLVSLLGVSKLTVENAFISYFRKSTEIYQGMELIDRKLGGTTPLDILISYESGDTAEEIFDDEEEDDFDDWDVGAASGPENWFTPFKIDVVKQAHDYLDDQPEVGKVLSLASAIRVAEEVNDGEEFDGVQLAVLYRKLPAEVREPLIDPYFSFEHNEARIQLRIIDSLDGLRRVALLQRITDGLIETLGLREGAVTVSGTLVLYNNMLQSLYQSQISTLGAVLLGIALMLLVLFRSLKLALIGIIPQILAATFVMGVMGLVGIPLDIMTITIAAITIGIAVDNAIHYIYRFREEFARSGDYSETLRICHATIGRAVFYTSATIIFGFSILSFSNFWPTIYFGVLTGLAMTLALVGVLTLLPRLILLVKPFGNSATVS
ncbi:MAG: MMPL family transporter [bacterium]|nr:MMPL family transporter [bacterium]